MKVNSSSNEAGLCGAGVLFMALDTNRFLFIKRSDTGDNAGCWCCPGGGVDDHETIEEGARREVAEEVGFTGDYRLHQLDRNLRDGYTFHNHIATVPTEFTPVLNHEHTDYVWTKEIPENLHPGLAQSLDAWQGRQGIEVSP